MTIGALWLVHPIQLTGVLYIVQRMTSLASLFSICAMMAYCFVRTRMLSEKGKWYYCLPVLVFGIFSVLFYWDNIERYKSMKSNLIKKELLSLISSFGIGEIIYLGIRWPTLYYFLEFGIEPYLASLISEIISTGCYMVSVTIFLRKTKTF